MNDRAVSGKRPAAMSGILVLGAIGAVALVWMASSGQLYGAPDWYMPYLFVSAAVGMTGIVGMFLMRKWGLYLYLGLFLLNQALMLSLGAWSLQALVVPVIVVVLGFRHFDQMR